MDDHALLQEYVARHSEPAFAELVERHLPLVHATAMRLVRDPHLANDVAQTVFIQLARHAGSIQQGHALAGWLYRTTQHAAFAAQRAEGRRRARETAAMNLAEQNEPTTALWEQFSPLLDDALCRLSRLDQDAVLLRFFHDRSYREVGAALGLDEDVARKRVERALDKIRLQFSRRGVTTTAALLSSAMVAHGAPPPPLGLAAKVSGTSLAGASGAIGVGGGSFAIWKILFMTTQSKIITAAVVVILLSVIPVGMYYLTSPTPDLATPPAPVVSKVVVNTPPKPILLSGPTVKVALPKLQAAAPRPMAGATALPPPSANDLDPATQKTITNHLRALVAASSLYMLDRKVTQATYSDIVGTGTDAYIRPDTLAPAAGEDYTDFTVDQQQTEVQVVTPGGVTVTFDM